VGGDHERNAELTVGVLLTTDGRGDLGVLVLHGLAIRPMSIGHGFVPSGARPGYGRSFGGDGQTLAEDP
jgi:hypothetical protein